jgi:glycosyltransferase involved in cell wall biosynthesis
MLNLHIYPSNIKNETRILKITESLIDMGISNNIIIIGIKEKNLLEHEKIDKNRDIWRVPLKKFSFLNWKIRKILRYLQWLWKIYFRFRKREIRMINCHSIFDLALGVVLKKRIRCKLIYDTHELETERNGLKGNLQKILKFVEKKSIKYVDHIFVVSDSIKNWYKETYELNNVTVIKNIPKKIRKKRELGKLRRIFKIPDKSIIYIYQGIFLHGRGIGILLSLFSKEDINSHIIFMGYGELKDQIKDYESRYEKIHLLDAVSPDNIFKYTSGADIGISLIENSCLSYYFSLPNKIFEYVFSGIPCLVSNFPDMGSFIEENKCGWVSEVNEDSVYLFIKNMLKKKIEKKKQNIRAILKRADFDWEFEQEKIKKVYQKLF